MAPESSISTLFNYSSVHLSQSRGFNTRFIAGWRDVSSHDSIPYILNLEVNRSAMI